MLPCFKYNQAACCVPQTHTPRSVERQRTERSEQREGVGDRVYAGAGGGWSWSGPNERGNELQKEQATLPQCCKDHGCLGRYPSAHSPGTPVPRATSPTSRVGAPLSVCVETSQWLFSCPHFRLDLSHRILQPQELFSPLHCAAPPATARNGEEPGEDVGEAASFPAPSSAKLCQG